MTKLVIRVRHPKVGDRFFITQRGALQWGSDPRKATTYPSKLAAEKKMNFLRKNYPGTFLEGTEWSVIPLRDALVPDTRFAKLAPVALSGRQWRTVYSALKFFGYHFRDALMEETETIRDAIVNQLTTCPDFKPSPDDPPLHIPE